MTKFHINKHGVPTPCKATKGSCPLGGDDLHFSSEKETQVFINNRMESEYGLLGGAPGVPTVKYITINHDFNKVFPDDWNEHGIQITGIYSEELEIALDDRWYNEEEDPWVKGYRDLHEAIKDDTDRILEESGDSDYALIPEKNMESHMRNYILFPGDVRYEEKSDEGWVTYNELKDSAVKHFGRDAIDRETYDEDIYLYDEDVYLNEALNEELIKFGAKRMRGDAQFNINGQSVYLESGNGLYGTNWVDEYAKEVKNGTEKSKFKVISED